MIMYLFLIFIIYSFLGWLWETLLYIIRDHRFVNRGFLYGPLCPIYGCGVIICSLVLYGRLNNPIELFFVGAVLCSSLEYFTHWVFELLFHSRWWDYSSKRFNLHGRICLKNSALFGLCIVLLFKFLNPFVIKRLATLPLTFLNVLTFVFYTLLVADITLTVTGLIGLKERLESLQVSISENIQKRIDLTEEKRLALIDKFESSQIYRERLQKLTHSSFNYRFVENFPRLTSERYKEALEKVREKLRLEK